MILPNKYTRVTESYIGISALLLKTLANKSLTVDELWNLFNRKYIKTKKIKNPPEYKKYIFTLMFMYATKMINCNESGEIYNENLRTSN